MSSFRVSRRDADEVFAEAATQALLTVAAAAFFVLGSLFISFFSEISRIWGVHAAPGQSARPTLMAGLKAFLGAWGVACLIALAGSAPLAALLGTVASLAFALFVFIIGARADRLLIPPRVGELDTYLTPFAPAESSPPSDPPEVPPSGPAKLRLLRPTSSQARPSPHAPQVPRQ